MKKKRMLLISVVILILLVSALAFCWSRQLSFSIVRCIAGTNGRYLYVDDRGGPVSMGSGSMFDGLQTGDLILVAHDGIEETYPARTGVYLCLRLKKGTIDEIPLDTYLTLAEMGWADPLPDYAVPEDFSIRFTWGVMSNNIYDTGAGLIQKDLVMDGVATAEFEPAPEVLQDIYNRILRWDILAIDREMTAEVLTKTGSAVAWIPLVYYRIEITADGETYLITGDETAKSYQDQQDAGNFTAFVNYMTNLMCATPEYQSLPEAVGGYD